MARVLVIDDDEDVRDVVLTALELRGHDGTAACDGASGLAAVRAHTPDVVLLDCRMPGLDGPGVLAAMQADPLLRRVPVVFMTADGGEEAKASYLTQGATDVLEKPFEPLALLELVRSITAGKRLD